MRDGFQEVQRSSRRNVSGKTLMEEADEVHAHILDEQRIRKELLQELISLFLTSFRQKLDDHCRKNCKDDRKNHAGILQNLLNKHVLFRIAMEALHHR